MVFSIEGDTLAKRYPFLTDDAEDISYRMYDLFVRHHPKLEPLFGGSREFHIQLFITLIDTPGRFDSKEINVRPNATNSFKSIINHPYLAKHPNFLSLHRRCLINAIEDVLFGEAHPQLIGEFKRVFDGICSKAQKHAA